MIPPLLQGNQLYFNGHHSPLSNFYPCNINFGNRCFTSTEQAYQWIKSIDIGNSSIANDILQTQDPYTIKKLSNELNQALVLRWQNKQGFQILYQLLQAKFDQIPMFWKTLLNSHHGIMLENTHD